MTLFPEMIEAPLRASLMGKAAEKNKVEFSVVQIRDFATDKHKSVDDTLFGGGPGMLLKVDVLHRAWTAAKTKTPNARTVLLSPQGQILTQKMAAELAVPVAGEAQDLILVCGHYEGVDERFIDLCVDQEISIGDYVLTGGELAALVLTDAVVRQIPGVVGDDDSILKDSLWNGLLKEPEYTRPREFEGKSVPDVLVSGNHAEIKKWAQAQSELRTQKKRPDLWEKYVGRK